VTTFTDLGSLPVSTLAANRVVHVRADDDLATVARAMTDADVGAVVVGGPSRKDGPRGVVSERDVVKAVAAGRDLATTTAADVASTSIVWCDASASVAEAAAEMMEQYVRHVLVEEGGHLVGIVSARDLLGAYAAVDLADVAE
jgi:CBS domain-containing protein